MKGGFACVAVGIALAMTARANADEPVEPVEPVAMPLATPSSPRWYELRHDTVIDATVTASAGVLWIGSELLKSSIGPATCRWCDRAADGTDTLNGMDASTRNALRWSNPEPANITSWIIGGGVAPVSALGLTALAAAHDGAQKNIGKDLLLVSEAPLVAVVLNQAVKFAVGRARPYAHAATPVGDSDANVSFFSQHTTLAFALAAASGTVTTMRGYRWAPMTWIVGGALALGTSYLRMAADRHYMSDVITGAVVGTGIGIGIPLVFHGRSGPIF